MTQSDETKWWQKGKCNDQNYVTHWLKKWWPKLITQINVMTIVNAKSDETKCGHKMITQSDETNWFNNAMKKCHKLI